jgi:hypothetical protein
MDEPRRADAAPVRRTGLKRRKPIRRATPKRASERAKYSRRCVIFKREHPWCMACITLWPEPPVIRWTVDVHHKMGCEGNLLLDERYWMPICRAHHDYFEDHGREARELGFVLDRDYRNVAN